MSNEQLMKCSGCRAECLPEFFSKKRNGAYYKTCDRCRKRHKCDQCEYACCNAANLRRHIKQVHDKVRDHVCDQCEYACSTAAHLHKHIKQVHDKVRDHKCDQCEYACSNATDLRRHIKAVHDKVRDHKCDQCDYTCSKATDLRRHIKQVHDKVKDHKCDQCVYECSRAADLRRHMKLCTGALNISSGELACRNILESLNITYNTEVSKIKNVDGNWLRFDFELTVGDRTMYIEVDGEQHFKPVRWSSSMTHETALANLRKVQRDDKHKDEWCAYNNLPLLRIPDTMIDSMRELVEAFVGEVL